MFSPPRDGLRVAPTRVTLAGGLGGLHRLRGDALGVHPARGGGRNMRGARGRWGWWGFLGGTVLCDVFFFLGGGWPLKGGWLVWVRVFEAILFWGWWKRESKGQAYFETNPSVQTTSPGRCGR